MTDVADTLDRAADYLEKHGWLQDWMGDNGGARCALGAIASAIRAKHGFMDTQSFLTECNNPVTALKEYLTIYQDLPRNVGIPSWNDTEGRTVTEVIDALHHAAKIERDK